MASFGLAALLVLTPVPVHADPPTSSPTTLLSSLPDAITREEQQIGAYVAAVAAAEARPPEPKPRPVPIDSSLAAFQRCVRQRESTNNYTVTNSAGASGAYQFMQGTWNNWAREMGRADLVGVLPANASPADQDAVFLYAAARTRSPWACTRQSGCHHAC